jgi:hypothetical protein
MNLIKIENNHYSFGEFTILSSYSKESKDFTFNVIREDYIPEKVTVKSFIEFKNKVSVIVAGMIRVIVETPAPAPVTSSSIDWDLSESELALANFIRSYNPDNDVVAPIIKDDTASSELASALLKTLETSSEEDYANFMLMLEEELAIS